MTVMACDFTSCTYPTKMGFPQRRDRLRPTYPRLHLPHKGAMINRVSSDNGIRFVSRIIVLNSDAFTKLWKNAFDAGTLNVQRSARGSRWNCHIAPIIIYIKTRTEMQVPCTDFSPPFINNVINGEDLTKIFQKTKIHSIIANRKVFAIKEKTIIFYYKV